MTLRRLRFSVRATMVLFVAILAIQFLPYGRAHDNPRVVAEPVWDSPETRALAKRACFDCHSNETQWPVYSNIAPASWLIQHDVSEGRTAVNFSEWQRRQEEASEAADEIRDGSMPLRMYLVMHAHARLSVAERERLALGLDRTIGSSRRQAARAKQ